MRISDWSSDVCSSDLVDRGARALRIGAAVLKAGVDLQHPFRAPDVDSARAARLRPPLLYRQIVPAVGIVGMDERADLGRRLVAVVDLAVGGQIGRASCRERGCQYV